MFSHNHWARTAIAFLIIVAPAFAFAQNASRKAPSLIRQPAQTATDQKESDDKLDVTDLEKKYWAAKDSEFSVVQNRLFSKTGRFTLSGSFGTMLNDPWATGNTFGANLGYYFNERWGVELFFSQTNSQDNQAVERLKNQAGYPDHNLLKDYYGVQVMFVPFYAKMSVMDWTIIYFDMSFALGMGMQSYDQMKEEGNSTVATPAVNFDVTQTFFLHKNFALRLDLKNRWYSEETVKYRSTYLNSPNRGNGASITNSSFLLFGLSLFY